MVSVRPFPLLPEWLPIASADRPATLRAFGSDMSDLVVDFASAERPRLITSLLARCSKTTDGRPTPDQAIWDLPVSTRTRAIIALADCVSGRPFEWRVRCGYPDCGSEGELELGAAEIEAFAVQTLTEKLIPVLIDAREVWLRRPTGADQRNWLDSGADSTEQMIESLIVDPTLEDLTEEGVTLDQISEAIDAAMDQQDPIVGFHLSVNCAACGRPTEHTPDLAGSAIQRLWSAQYELLEQIHLLASHYHWTESEIVRLPLWRLQAYLSYIDAYNRACKDGGER